MSLDSRNHPAQVKGYRGEPWTIRGRILYDRNGDAFGEVYAGAEKMGETIVLAVNALTNAPMRPTDPITKEQLLALLVLKEEAEKMGDDPK